MTIQLLQYLSFGVAAGAVGAFFGIGGGLVLVPLLTLTKHMPFQSAAGISLVGVVAMSVASTAVHLRSDRVELATGGRLQFFTVFGAVGAALLAGTVPPRPLFLAFGILLIYVSLLMVRPGSAVTPSCPTALERRMRLASAASVGTGIIAGFLGVGGGMINTPVLHKLLGFPIDRAIATSSYMIGITGSAAALIFLLRGDVDAEIAGPIMLGVVVGAGLVAAVGHRVEHRIIKTSFAIVVLIVAAQMVGRAFA